MPEGFRQFSQKCCRLRAFGSAAFLKSGFTYTGFLLELPIVDYFFPMLLVGDYFSFLLGLYCQNSVRLSQKLYLFSFFPVFWVFLEGGSALPLHVAVWMANSLLMTAFSQRLHCEVLDSHCLKCRLKSLAGTFKSQYSQCFGFMRQVLACSSAQLFLNIREQCWHLELEWNSSSWSSRKFLSYISPQMVHLMMFLRQQPKWVGALEAGMGLPQLEQSQVYSIINKINGKDQQNPPFNQNSFFNNSNLALANIINNIDSIVHAKTLRHTPFLIPVDV